MKKKEKLREYYLVMKKLAIRETIEDQYATYLVELSILHGVKELYNFKERLWVYEEIWEEN